RIIRPRTPPSINNGVRRSNKTVPAEPTGPYFTVCGPLIISNWSKVSGAIYELGASIRLGQAPITSPPSNKIFNREPPKPRSTGSLLVPPLFCAEKPGVRRKKSPASLAGIGCRACLGSPSITNPWLGASEEITIGEKRIGSSATANGVKEKPQASHNNPCNKKPLRKTLILKTPTCILLG